MLGGALPRDIMKRPAIRPENQHDSQKTDRPREYLATADAAGPSPYMAQVFYGPCPSWPKSFMAQVLHVFRGLSSGLGPALVNNAPVCGPAYLLWPFVLHGGTPYETKGGFLELSSQLSIDLTHARELRSLNRGAAIEN